MKRDEKGRFNRPYYVNYYFRQIDLVDGPPDRTSFCDHLTMVYQYPESSDVWEIEYLVATPAGLRDFMNRSDFDSLYLDHSTVIVREWNLATILRTLMDEQMRALDGSPKRKRKKGRCLLCSHALKRPARLLARRGSTRMIYRMRYRYASGTTLPLNVVFCNLAPSTLFVVPNTLRSA